jgi:hypothetical protein
MIYCEGRNCSRRDECAYHEDFESKYPRQYLDLSTVGRGYDGIDENGKWFHHHDYCCGDKAEKYHCYKELGYRD